ncbi:tRNA acetyltransferase TAN1 [Pelomyxa schiedti]|nr:tRNA acetyltransferase TAN1 [Pelomyxa schiedti]
MQEKPKSGDPGEPVLPQIRRGATTCDGGVTSGTTRATEPTIKKRRSVVVTAAEGGGGDVTTTSAEPPSPASTSVSSPSPSPSPSPMPEGASTSGYCVATTTAATAVAADGTTIEGERKTTAAAVPKKFKPARPPMLAKHTQLFYNTNENPRGLIITHQVSRGAQAVSECSQMLTHVLAKMQSQSTTCAEPTINSTYASLSTPISASSATPAVTSLLQTSTSEASNTTTPAPTTTTTTSSSAPPPPTAANATVDSSLDSTTHCRKFQFCHSGVEGKLGIRILDKAVDPVVLLHALFEDIATNPKEYKIKVCCRMYPAQSFVAATKTTILEAAGKLIANHFTETPETFGILYDCRNNESFERKDMIDSIAKLVPPIHKVELSNPSSTILVTVSKSACGIGIVRDFKQWCKYNVQEIAKTHPPTKKP